MIGKDKLLSLAGTSMSLVLGVLAIWGCGGHPPVEMLDSPEPVASGDLLEEHLRDLQKVIVLNHLATPNPRWEEVEFAQLSGDLYYSCAELIGAPVPANLDDCEHMAVHQEARNCVLNKLLEIAEIRPGPVHVLHSGDPSISVPPVDYDVTPQRSEANLGVLEETIRYARFVLNEHKTLYPRFLGLNSTSQLVCPNSALTERVFGESATLPMGAGLAAALVETFSLYEEALKAAVRQNLAIGDRLRATPTLGSGIEEGVLNPVMSRAHAAHLILGGDEGLPQMGIMPGIDGQLPGGLCTSGRLTGTEAFALEILRESGVAPDDVLDSSVLLSQLLNGVTSGSISGTCWQNSSSGAPRCGSVRQRLADFRVKEFSGGTVETAFGLRSSDFDAARSALGEEYRAFARSRRAVMAPIPFSDGTTSSIPRFAATATQPRNHDAAYFGLVARYRENETLYDQDIIDNHLEAVGEPRLFLEGAGGVVDPFFAAQVVDYVGHQWALYMEEAEDLGAPFTTTNNEKAALFDHTSLLVSGLSRRSPGRVQVCWRDALAPPFRDLSVTVGNFTLQEWDVVIGHEGLDCAVNGAVEGQPCNLSDYRLDLDIGGANSDPSNPRWIVTDSYPTMKFPHGSNRLSGADFTAPVPPIYIVTPRPGTIGELPGQFDALVGVQGPPSGLGCREEAIYREGDEWVAQILAPSPKWCAKPEVECNGERFDARLPLEDELSDDNNGVENSWQHYVQLARIAADRADQLGQEYIANGIALDSQIEDQEEAAEIRRESQRIQVEQALEEFQLHCGVSIDPADPLLALSTSAKKDLSETREQVSCITSADCSDTYKCYSGQCIRDVLAVAKQDTSIPTNRKIIECLEPEETYPLVTAGNVPVCVWYPKYQIADMTYVSDPSGVCALPSQNGGSLPAQGTPPACPVRAVLDPGFDPQGLDRTDINAARTCDDMLVPFWDDVAGKFLTSTECLANPTCQNEYQVVKVETLLGLFDNSLDSTANVGCNAVRAVRDGTGDLAGLDQIRGAFDIAQLSKFGGMLGWRAKLGGYSDILLNNAVNFSTGTAESGPNPVGWPCNGTSRLACDSGLFCREGTDPAVTCEDDAFRARMNYRMADAVWAAKAITTGQIDEYTVPLRYGVTAADPLQVTTSRIPLFHDPQRTLQVMSWPGGEGIPNPFKTYAIDDTSPWESWSYPHWSGGVEWLVSNTSQGYHLAFVGDSRPFAYTWVPEDRELTGTVGKIDPMGFFAGLVNGVGQRPSVHLSDCPGLPELEEGPDTWQLGHDAQCFDESEVNVSLLLSETGQSLAQASTIPTHMIEWDEVGVPVEYSSDPAEYSENLGFALRGGAGDLVREKLAKRGCAPVPVRWNKPQQGLSHVPDSYLFRYGVCDIFDSGAHWGYFANSAKSPSTPPPPFVESPTGEIDHHFSRRNLWDGFELLCEAIRNQGSNPDFACQLGIVPEVDDADDLSGAAQYLSCLAKRIEHEAGMRVFANMPKRAVEILTGNDSIGAAPGIGGEFATAVSNLRAAIEGQTGVSSALATELRAFGNDIETLKSELNILELQRDLDSVELVTAIASGIHKCLTSMSVSKFADSYGGQQVLDCGLAAVEIGAALTAYSIKNKIKLESTDIKLAQFDTNFAQRAEGFRLIRQQQAIATEGIDGLLAAIENGRLAAQRALDRALLMDAFQTSVVYRSNAASRVRLNTNKFRYNQAFENARRMTFFAKRAVEQRLGQYLSEMTDPLPLVDAPSKWESSLCYAEGVDYAAIRDTQFGLAFDGGNEFSVNYAHSFIGDYVTRLENVVESYRIANSFHEGADTMVVSLRDDVMHARVDCNMEVDNLLYFGENPAALTVSPEEVPGWQVTGCAEDGNGGLLPDCLLVGAAGNEDAANLNRLLRAEDKYTGDTVPGIYRVDFGTSGEGVTCSPTTCGYRSDTNLSQTVELTPGRYRLSYRVWAGDAEGQLSSTSAFVQNAVKIYDRLGNEISGDFRVEDIPNGGYHIGIKMFDASDVKVTVSILPSLEVEQALGVGQAGYYLGALMLQSVSDAEDIASPLGSFRSSGRNRTQLVSSGCEDKDGTAFRQKFWVRECVPLCESGFTSDCPVNSSNLRCYWQTSFPVSQRLIESGRQFEHAGFALGNFNYRIESVGLNFVGSALRECSGSDAKQACFAGGFVPYSLRHEGPYTVRNHRGDDFRAELFPGVIEHARGLASERYISNPLSSPDRDLLSDYMRAEYQGRPLDGMFYIRVWDDPAVDFAAIEDIQLVMNYRYWTRFE